MWINASSRAVVMSKVGCCYQPSSGFSHESRCSHFCVSSTNGNNINLMECWRGKIDILKVNSCNTLISSSEPFVCQKSFPSTSLQIVVVFMLWQRKTSIQSSGLPHHVWLLFHPTTTPYYFPRDPSCATIRIKWMQFKDKDKRREDESEKSGREFPPESSKTASLLLWGLVQGCGSVSLVLVTTTFNPLCFGVGESILADFSFTDETIFSSTTKFSWQWHEEHI